MSKPSAIITGAGGAIAGHLVRACAAAGWQLALIAYDEREETRLIADHPHAHVVRGNLADASAAASTMQAAIASLGAAPNALFNIAGGFDMADAVATTPEQLEAQLSINLRTAFNATRAVLPGMLERGSGFVLGVGAAAAIDGGASVGAYAASKAALVTWLKSLRAEVASNGVEVGIVYPMGAVDTPGNRAAMPKSDPSRWIDPDELAVTMLHLATRSARGRVLEARVYPPA
ncbi:MAG TPA: SDR family oxidoreductase [Rhodanobacteraceae bacterium]|nr:SDR family oxidoreductase [Rhodanobacteraceae bacterium]